MPKPGANVRTTPRTWGFSVAATHDLRPAGGAAGDQTGVGGDRRPVVSGGIGDVHPVSSQIAVWYSKIACSVPWLISGWYGV
jgi:hypothetical protein